MRATLTEVLELSDFMSFFLGGFFLQQKQSQNLKDLVEALQIFLPFQMMWHGPYTHRYISISNISRVKFTLYFFAKALVLFFPPCWSGQISLFLKGGFSKVKWSQTVHSTSFHLFFFKHSMGCSQISLHPRKKN